MEQKRNLSSVADPSDPDPCGSVYVLCIYYSDNQAQGRYIMPALYPAMYFVTAGWNRLLERFVKKENIRMWIYRILTALLAASPFLCYIFLVVPFYG